MSQANVHDDAPTENDERPEPISFTLVVLSPSVGIDRPLTFPHLLATTSIKELKAKIRDALTTKPADDNQRLIHRGRLLTRETETMTDVFGRETLASPESQTLHLVLRPTGTESSPTPIIPPQRMTTPLPQFVARPQSTPANPSLSFPPQTLPGFQHVQQHQLLHQAEQMQQVMGQRLHHLQQETMRLHQEMVNIEQRSRQVDAQRSRNLGVNNPPVPHNQFQVPPINSFQNLLNQQQRDRSAEGLHGVPIDAGGATGDRQTLSGRASPNIPGDHTTTHTRQAVGPNGERWQITVNETTTTFPATHIHGHHHVPHNPANPLENFQSILRNADRILAARNLQNNMQQIAATGQPVAANSGSVTQYPPSGADPTDTSVSVGVPTPANSSPSSSAILNQILNPNIALNVAASTNAITNQANINPMVYLLSTPQGPRAILLSNSETFFTPSLPSRRRRHDSPAPVIGQGGVRAPEARHRVVQREARIRDAQNDQANLAQPIAAPAPAPVPANPVPGAQIGPMLWLVVRLSVFVWFFTSGNSSWMRLFTMFVLAMGVFIYNTGVLNRVAEQVWGPIRRHIEALIPLAAPEPIPAAADVAAPAGNDPAPRRRAEPDPAAVAARLVEQHRDANAGWLMDQVRRAEHAALLFLASLVPGVGERHIAAREAVVAAAETERQRQIEAASAENAQETSQENLQGGNGEQDGETQEPQDARSEAAPLVDV